MLVIILILQVVKKIVAKDSWPSVKQVTQPKASPSPTPLFQLMLFYCKIEAQEKVIKQLLGG